MQSGITASTTLQDAFNTFTSNSSLFALPIVIEGESLTPQDPVSFTDSFNTSLSSLKGLLTPSKPIYLILRSSPQQNHDLIAVTYVPSTAPVRQKMLYASTRNTLTRDLGLEKFSDFVFATDDFEILDPKQWEVRRGTTKAENEDILTHEERTLQAVKRAEETERHGTSGRDLMGSGGSGSKLAMKSTEEARGSLRSLQEEGSHVQLGIDVSSETLELIREGSEQLGSLVSGIPGDKPSYTFYRYGTEDIVFIYTCPLKSKVKERMIYASARLSVLKLAESEGVTATKRLEQGDVGEITEERIVEEVGGGGGAPQKTAGSSFARPKRPGRR